MNKILKAAFLAATLAVGTSASAAVVVFNAGGTITTAPATPISTDISSGDFVIATETLDPLGTNTFTFTALNDLVVSTIALAGVGTNTGADLAQVRFGFTATPATPFSSIVPNPDTASATGILPGFSLLAGDSFTIFWESVAPSASGTVGIAASFFTTDPPPIPLPAALPLLAGGIALLGLVRRKA
ncbi:hypothetical protein DKT77_05180 [Meridianimarinicoccus roseus]|uniref:Uncharacterized protein n=1 Tax=Meridianimarinicoccus roseus TaxID=2072018 RepID=A0A2V2LDV9_9RHOB|nr:hypothetical protein [Meridianimarinicoccus roseus]PWR03728.1 hypothetical protein DKT77_05180 [Meridianimarinicoccus roseus]